MPKTYHTFGAAMRLANKVKLIPAVENRYGGVFMNQKFRSNQFSADVIFKMNSPKQSSNGMVFWYLHRMPSFDTQSPRIHAISQDTNGLAIWLYKTEDNKWRIFAHYDSGDGQVLETSKVYPSNSCTLVLDPTVVPVKIRVEKIMNKLSVFVTDDSADSNNWRNCVSFHNSKLNYHGYFGFTSGNLNGITNDIDIQSFRISDLSPSSVYLSKDNRDAEIGYIDFKDAQEEPKKAKDILHNNKVRMESKYAEVMKAIEFADDDDTELLLFKFWETIRMYNINLGSMVRTLRNYEREKSEIFEQTGEDKNLPQLTQDLKNAQDSIETIGNSMMYINDTLTFLSSEVEDIQTPISDQEYDYTSELIQLVNNLNTRLDGLENKMRTHKDSSKEFTRRVTQQSQEQKEKMGNVMLEAVNTQSGYIQKSTDEGAGYTLTIVIVI